MSLLKPLGEGIGYLKAGFLGFPKSGKTYTAVDLAIGARVMLGLKGPVVCFDTEGGSEYIAPRVLQATGQPLVGLKSRSFSDLVAAAHEAEALDGAVLIVDSITHVWRELCDAYLKRVNDVRVSKGQSKRTRMEFQDWAHVKGQWNAQWTDFYLNSRLHIIICGRAGYEYDYEDREDGGKDLVKTGVKMKTEGEFGFEPSLLVQMERVPVLDKGSMTLTHRATILGDRFDVIDAQTCDNPSFAFFAPHVALLKPGAHTPIDMAVKSDAGVTDDGDTAWHKERRTRTILCEEIQGELTNKWPGQTAAEKKAKTDLLFQVFDTRSWTAVEGTESVTLRNGLRTIREILQTQPQPVRQPGAAFDDVSDIDAALDAATTTPQTEAT